MTRNIQPIKEYTPTQCSDTWHSTVDMEVVFSHEVVIYITRVMMIEHIFTPRVCHVMSKTFQGLHNNYEYEHMALYN